MATVKWMDLLGSPYRLHGTGRDGYDCSSLAEAVLMRMGRTVPPTSPFRAMAGVVSVRGFAVKNVIGIYRVKNNA